MPLFVCFCPDYPNNLETRLSVREKHLEMGRKDHEAGKSVFGRAFVNPNSDYMAGSTMLYRYPSLEDAWARIKADPYWTAGVWDKEKVRIEQLASGPQDESLRLA